MSADEPVEPAEVIGGRRDHTPGVALGGHVRRQRQGLPSTLEGSGGLDRPLEIDQRDASTGVDQGPRGADSDPSGRSGDDVDPIGEIHRVAHQVGRASTPPSTLYD